MDTLDTCLDTCLDADAMRAHLAALLPECRDGGLRVTALDVLQPRRSASRRRQPHPLTLSYRLELQDPANGRCQALRLYAKVFREGASALHLAPRTLHLPALDMRLWRFPQDPGLPQLQRLLDPGFTLPWWPRPASAVDTLRYEPENRATLCFRHGAEALYAKTFADDRAEAVHRRFQHFWQLAEHNPFAPTVAEPLGHDAATRSVWQAEAEGRPLRERLQTAAPSGVAVRLAAAFAAVHAAPASLAGPVARDGDHWRREIGRRSRKIGRALPALAPRVHAIAAALDHAAAALPALPLVLIHGDCHPDQVWLGADDRVVLFDFDEFTLGDPMEDLAQFVTRLGDAGGSARFGSEIVAAYANLAPAAFSAPRLRWQLALQQLLQASRAFVFQAPGWPLLMAQRLARAEMLLDDGCHFGPDQLAA